MKQVALLFALALPAYTQIYFDDTSAAGLTLGNAVWELLLSKTNGGVCAHGRAVPVIFSCKRPYPPTTPPFDDGSNAMPPS